METYWKRFGLPLSLVIACGFCLISWNRLFYGVDLIKESKHVLYQIDLLSGDGLFRKELGIDQIAQLLVYPIFRGVLEFTEQISLQGLVLQLRELKLALSWVLSLGLALMFHRHVAFSAMCLFAAPVVVFLPLGIAGIHPLGMAVPLGVLVITAAWRWMQAPTILKSWLLPVTGLLLVLALPEVLPVMVFVLFALLFRASKPEDPKLVKLHLAASLNLTVLIGFLTVRALNHDGLFEAWRLQHEILGWKGTEASAWAGPSEQVSIVFAIALVLAFVLPSKYFHLLFAGLAIFFAAWGWASTEFPAEFLIVMLAPLVLCHFWRIRKSLPTDFGPGFFVAASLLLAGILAVTRGLPGLAVGLLPVIIFFFASGWVRELRWLVITSAVVFLSLMTIAQFKTLPPGQARRDSIDVISTGAFKGISVPRPVSLELQHFQDVMAKLPPGPVSIFVYDEKPGYYLISDLEPLGFLYRVSGQHGLAQEVTTYLGTAENLPDVAVDVFSQKNLSEKSPMDGFFEAQTNYQIFEDHPKFRVWVKTEFIENALRRL